ncbi:unnamed protein product, partial [Adineta steineri]
CEVVGSNFSCATTPELILKTFAHYCEYKKAPTSGVVLAPNKYDTQRVIAFLKQCIEHGGFYRTSDHTWIHLERIQFVGACNPPTDPGRKPLIHRFLRHCPLVYVDYPGEISLKQIYGSRSSKYSPGQVASPSSHNPNVGSVTPTQSSVRSMNSSLSKQHPH